jgi:hypothetical protein
MTHTEKLVSSVLLIKTAHTLSEIAEADAEMNPEMARRKAEMDDIYPKGVLPTATDYLFGASSATNAGKRTALAKALGRQPSTNLEYPISRELLNTLVGALAGSAAGAGLGGLIGNEQGGPIGGAGVGAAAGGVLGALAGLIKRRYDARQEHDQNEKDYIAGEEKRPVLPLKKSLLSQLVTPLSGFHRAGEATAFSKLKGNRHETETLNKLVNTLATLSPTPGRLLGGAVQNVRANEIIDRNKGSINMRDLLRGSLTPY